MRHSDDPVKHHPENDVDLCSHMNTAKANMDIAYQLWPTGRLRAMAGRLSAAQAALREAEWRINDILREKEKS